MSDWRFNSSGKKYYFKEHALNKNNLHELLAEPNINKYIKYHIAIQNRPETIGILKNIYTTTYNKVSSQQQEAQSNEPPKTKIEASAFLSYESNFVIYDTKGYDGLVHIELASPYLQQQINRRGNKMVVKVNVGLLIKNR